MSTGDASAQQATPTSPGASPAGAADPRYTPREEGRDGRESGGRSVEVSFVRSLYGLVVIGSVTLFGAASSYGSVAEPLLLTLITCSAAIISYGRVKAGKTPPLGSLLGNLLALGALSWVAFGLLSGAPATVMTVGNLVHVLLWVKLLQRKQNRDYIQILLLSFVQMVVTAVMTDALWYGAAAILYLLLATWVMLLFHFKREGDGDFLPTKTPIVDWRRYRTRNLVSRAFIGLLAGTLLLTSLGTVFVFVGLPRDWGQDLLRDLVPRPPQNKSGLNEETNLSGGGAVSQDYNRALYVEYPSEAAVPTEPLYRAVIQDRYDPLTHRWTVAPTAITAVEQRPAMPEGAAPDERWVEITDVQRPRKTSFLAAPGPIAPRQSEQAATVSQFAVEMREPPIPREPPKDQDQLALYVREYYRTMELSKSYRGRITYRTLSREMPKPREVAAASLRTAAEAPATNSQIASRVGRPFPGFGPPESGERQEIVQRRRDAGEALRRELRAWLDEQLPDLPVRPNAWTVADATRVSDLLRTSPFEYSLDNPTPPAGTDPNVWLLRDSHSGYCARYASALALLLWARGIDAHVVAGFAGGQNWIDNDRGETAVDVVTNAQAHAWVEIYAKGHGWVALNPSQEIGSQPESMDGWSLWLAGMQYRWQRYVINFDSTQQEQIAAWLNQQVQAVIAWVRSVGATVASWFAGDDGVPGESVQLAVGLIVLVPPLVALGVWIWRRRRRRRSQRRVAQRSEFRPMQEVLAVLQGAQLRRDPASTPAEFLRTPQAAEIVGDDDRERLLRCYHAARFGGEPPADADEAWLASLLERIKQRLREWKQERPAQRSTHGGAEPAGAV